MLLAGAAAVVMAVVVAGARYLGGDRVHHRHRRSGGRLHRGDGAKDGHARPGDRLRRSVDGRSRAGHASHQHRVSRRGGRRLHAGEHPDAEAEQRRGERNRSKRVRPCHLQPIPARRPAHAWLGGTWRASAVPRHLERCAAEASGRGVPRFVKWYEAADGTDTAARTRWIRPSTYVVTRLPRTARPVRPSSSPVVG